MSRDVTTSRPRAWNIPTLRDRAVFKIERAKKLQRDAQRAARLAREAMAAAEAAHANLTWAIETRAKRDARNDMRGVL